MNNGLETELVFESPKIYSVRGYSGEKHPNLTHKLVPLDQLPILGEWYRSRYRPISFTSGTYDMIHIGHGRYLKLARELAGEDGVLVVGLNSDVSVRSYKGPNRPILEELKRAEMLAFLGSVDYITLYDGDTADGVIRLLKPDRYLCVEGSWMGGWEELKNKPEVIAMAEHGGEVYCSPPQEPGLSTSKIINKLTTDGMHEVYKEFKELVTDLGQRLPSLHSL